jgi:hypothetical protein
VFNLDRLADRTEAASMRVRVADVVSLALWLGAIALLVFSTVQDSNHLGRWALLMGMMALAATFWSVATWVVEVMRMEFEISKLRQLPTRRAGSG